MKQSLADDEARYHEALKRRNEAQAQLRSLVNQGSHSEASQDVCISKQERLTSHLHDKRQKRQQARLAVLDVHSRQARDFVRKSKIESSLQLPSLQYESIDQGVENDRDAHERSPAKTLSNKASALQHELEIALVIARQRLKDEQALLEDVQERQQMRSASTDSASTKLFALEKTRAELQVWLAENLARCEESIVDESRVEVTIMNGDSPEGTQGKQPSIDIEYESYLEIRERLLRAMQVLRAAQQQCIERRPIASSPELGSNSMPEVQKSITDHHESKAPALAQLQHSMLPTRNHEGLLGAYAAHLRDRSDIHDTKLLQTLSLLSHESHLLPSYPVNSRAAAAATTECSAKQKDIDRLLYAWSSASNAANEALWGNVESQAKAARSALSQSEADLEELRVLEHIRKLSING